MVNLNLEDQEHINHLKNKGVIEDPCYGTKCGWEERENQEHKPISYVIKKPNFQSQ